MGAEMAIPAMGHHFRDGLMHRVPEDIRAPAEIVRARPEFS